MAIMRNDIEKPILNDLEISGAHVFAKNFEGEEKKKNGKIVNSAGTRTFCVEIDPDIAQDLKNDGWNITMRINQEDNSMFCYLPVEVRFRPIRPVIYAITNDVKRSLDEDQIHQLDHRNFSNADLLIHPRVWFDEDENRWRVKAFLAEGWFYIRQSRFAEQWENRHMGVEE